MMDSTLARDEDILKAAEDWRKAGRGEAHPAAGRRTGLDDTVTVGAPWPCAPPSVRAQCHVRVHGAGTPPRQ